MDIFTKVTTVVAMVTDERDEISQDEQVTWGIYFTARYKLLGNCFSCFLSS